MSINPILAESGLVGGVGGQGGNAFSNTNFSNGPTVVKYLEVYKNNGALTGLLLEYTDGTRQRIGKANSDVTSITFAAGERLTFLGLWGNGVGSRCAGIRLITNKNQKLECVVDKNHNEYPQPVFSGIIAGARGRSGEEMDILGLIFVRPIQKISITINDTDWRNNPIGTNAFINSTILSQSVITNPEDDPLAWSFNGAQTVTESHTFTQSATTTWGVSVEVSASIFDIGVKATTFWERASMTSNATTHEESATMGTTISGTLEKGETILCTTTCLLGTLDLQYTSHVKIIVDTGATLEYDEAGEFKNSVYAYAQTSYSKIGTTNRAMVEFHRAEDSGDHVDGPGL
ncbi:hypothetical protein E8E14_004865 [Neopestalotiopsis sp. 37M]|nr:hypothetical protein E8E14_004865 [Neopestalotiopsis sp. 37M]